ncbi:MAG: hypothetical protein LBP19_10620 [Treponema sp.]|jgi:hypothetical protein|nr:hypothetical protein [Treponema sp.]
MPEGYYDEIITEFAENIRRLLRNLLWNITAGNTIYPTNAEEAAALSDGGDHKL